MSDAPLTPTDQAPAQPASIAVTRADAGGFLDGLLTVDVSDLGEEEIRPGALLSPQGKIQHALTVRRITEGYVLATTDGALTDRLVKRLTLLKLRAAVEIAPLPAGDHAATPSWADHKTRILAGLPVQGVDFGFEDVFPTDVNLDLLGGVNYKKGCFIGQEVVSRMARRGSIRKRTLILTHADGVSIEAQTPVTSADGDRLGVVTSTTPGASLALMRTDRLVEAGGLEATVHVGDIACAVAPPPYALVDTLGLSADKDAAP